MGPYIVNLAQSAGTERGLAQVISTTEQLVHRKMVDDSSLFEVHRIPKRKRGEFREVIEIANEALSDAMKALNTRLLDYIISIQPSYPDPSCHGYIKGRSIYTNAEVHLRARWLVRADIEKFFPTITVARVESALLDLGLPLPASNVLAGFLTFHGSLPLGFPTSPTIANLVCLKLDKQLSELAVTHECKYSRYSDDLTFSGKGSIPSYIEISSILRENEFYLNREKFRIKKRGQVFYVTGLSVSEPDRPRAPHKLKRRLRQELFHAEKRGLRFHLGKKGYNSFQSGVNKIDGRLRFLNAIEPAFAASMLGRWRRILIRDGMEPVHVPRTDRSPRSVTMLFDESIVESSNGPVLLLGCVVTEDLDSIRGELSNLLARVLADPYIDGRKPDLEKKGLHWVDISEDVRTHVVQTISSFTVRAYVSYQLFPKDADFVETYLSLLKPMLGPRFRALDRCIVQLKFEQHQSLKAPVLEKVVREVYSELNQAKSRMPRVQPTVAVVSKIQEPCITVVDAMLAVLGEYAKSDANPIDTQQKKRKQSGEHVVNRFERFRAKYRLIRSHSTSEIFTRRNRFEPWRNGDPTSRKSD